MQAETVVSMVIVPEIYCISDINMASGAAEE